MHAPAFARPRARIGRAAPGFARLAGMRPPVLVVLVGCVGAALGGALAGILGGCLERGTAPPFDRPPDGTDPRGRGCQGGLECPGDEVCARNDACLPPDQVRAVHVMWTVAGQPASVTGCAASRALRIRMNRVDGAERGVNWAPVPCEAGKFSVDRLPRSYDHVWLGRESGGGEHDAALDRSTGEATLDLP